MSGSRAPMRWGRRARRQAASRIGPALLVVASCGVNGAPSHPMPVTPPATAPSMAPPHDGPRSSTSTDAGIALPPYSAEVTPDALAPEDLRVTSAGVRTTIPKVAWCESLPIAVGRCSASNVREALQADRERLGATRDVRAVLVSARTHEADAARLRATDGALAALEGCADLPSGLVRALRAWMTPDCAETLAAPLLRGPKSGVAAPTWELLRGLAIASRIRRWKAPSFPQLTATDAAAIARFVRQKVSPWVESLAGLRALEPKAALAPRGYGSLAVQVAWVDAWERVAHAGDLRLPRTPPFEGDSDLVAAYNEAVDPILSEARAKAQSERLVARAMAADLGVLDDPRLGESPMDGKPVGGGWSYVGFPLSPPHESSTLAAELPTPFAAALLANEALEPAMWSALLARGAPRELRAATSAWLATHADDARAPLLHLALARAHVRLGVLYLRRFDFARARIELHHAPATDETILLATLSEALPPEDDTVYLAQGMHVDFAPLERVAERASSESIRRMATMNLRLLQASCAEGAERSRLVESLRNEDYGAPRNECLRHDFAPGRPWSGEPAARCPWPWRGR